MQQFLSKAIFQVKNAFRYSLEGLKAAFHKEFAFYLEMIIFAIAFPSAFFLGHNSVERALLISTLFLVLVVELLNSALEATLNRISRSWNPLTKYAKDVGSAAVMLTIINVLIVWIIILF